MKTGKNSKTKGGKSKSKTKKTKMNPVLRGILIAVVIIAILGAIALVVGMVQHHRTTKVNAPSYASTTSADVPDNSADTPAENPADTSTDSEGFDPDYHPDMTYGSDTYGGYKEAPAGEQGEGAPTGI